MMGVCVCGGSRGGFSVNLLPDDFMISYVWFFFFFFVSLLFFLMILSFTKFVSLAR